ncbi:MAG: helix-turn-helix transcriptional regulator [Clostridia bacterium]|nr:helix-turn-helix transcriptional regulator [Clostridia bacterium]
MNPFIVRDISHYCNISVSRCQPIPERIIPFYDLTFVLSGSMTYTLGGKKFPMKKSDAILFRPGDVRGRLAGTEAVSYVSFNFTVADENFMTFDRFLPHSVTAEIRRLISVFPQSHLSPYYHSAEKAASMLNYILLELADVMQSGCNNEHVLNILRYVDSHITEKLTLKSVSSHVNLSKEYTCAIFRQEVGKTVTEYINERKMLLAKELILKGEMSLNDISTHLSFENYAYFSRLFKRYFDVTPVSLQKKNR